MPDDSLRKPSFLVGIAGGSASGKTTFTHILADRLRSETYALKVDVFGMDKYFYRGTAPGPVFTSPSTGELLPNNNHPNSADNARLIEDLDELRNSKNRPDVILLEGLMILHIEEIRNRCDLRIFMELDADIRALRRLLRDMKGSRGSTDPNFIATYYIECARVGHALYVEPSRVYADLILRGDADFHRSVEGVAGAIFNRNQTRIET